MDRILYRLSKRVRDFNIKVIKINIFLSEIRIQYNSIEPLRHLYHGILINNMEMIAIDIKSINRIVNSTDEVMTANKSIISLE